MAEINHTARAALQKLLRDMEQDLDVPTRPCLRRKLPTGPGRPRLHAY